MDMDEDKLDDMDAVDASFTVPLIGGNMTVIKQLSNDESVNQMESTRCSWKSARRKLKTGQTRQKQATYQLEQCSKATPRNSGPA